MFPAALGVLLVGGCVSSSSAPPQSPASARPPESTVASFFSPPQPYPGPAWTRDGRSVDRQELEIIAGPEHCEWQAVAFLYLGWPPGTTGKSRQFIRDPGDVLQGAAGAPASGIRLPADARDSRYRHRDLQLWLSPSDPDGVYLRAGTDVERWPRADPVIGCD